eukprot:jgi/Mesen1/4365/ME000022S03648
MPYRSRPRTPRLVPAQKILVESEAVVSSIEAEAEDILARMQGINHPALNFPENNASDTLSSPASGGSTSELKLQQKPVLEPGRSLQETDKTTTPGKTALGTVITPEAGAEAGSGNLGANTKQAKNLIEREDAEGREDNEAGDGEGEVGDSKGGEKPSNGEEEEAQELVRGVSAGKVEAVGKQAWQGDGKRRPPEAAHANADRASAKAGGTEGAVAGAGAGLLVSVTKGSRSSSDGKSSGQGGKGKSETNGSSRRRRQSDPRAGGSSDSKTAQGRSKGEGEEEGEREREREREEVRAANGLISGTEMASWQAFLRHVKELGEEKERVVTAKVPVRPYEAGPVGTGTLGWDMKRSSLIQVVMQKHYSLDTHKHLDYKFADSCRGARACPQFGKCDGPEHSAPVAMCHQEEFVDQLQKGDPPLNMPSETQYTTLLHPYAGNIFMLENVYLNGRGLVFNKTHVFMAGGVTRFKVLVDAVVKHGTNFYHTITEVLPAFVLLSKVIQANQGIPVAIHDRMDSVGPMRSWLPLVGVHLDDLNIHRMNYSRHLFFAEKLLMPAQIPCGKPSASLFKVMRKRYLKLTPKRLRRKEPLWRYTKDEWTLVVGMRPPNATRHLKQHDEIWKALTDRYGPSRLRLFVGDETTEETMKIFSKALIYLGPHGAGMTNMLWMPPHGVVVEVMPQDNVNLCYHLLASHCEHDYFMLLGAGNFTSSISIPPLKVISTIEKLLPPKKVKVR